MSDYQHDLRIIERKEIRAQIERKQRRHRLLNFAVPVAIILVLLNAFMYWLNTTAGIITSLLLAIAVVIGSKVYNAIK